MSNQLIKPLKSVLMFTLFAWLFAWQATAEQKDSRPFPKEKMQEVQKQNQLSPAEQKKQEDREARASAEFEAAAKATKKKPL